MPSKRKPTVQATSTDPFVFTYSKPDTKTLISDLSEEPLGLSDGQIYSPINEVFLQLNESNAYTTTFNYNIMAKSILGVDCDDGSSCDGSGNGDDDGENENGRDSATEAETETGDADQSPRHVGGFATLMCEDTLGNLTEKRAFIKFSPLLDPIRYLVGKYDMNDESLKNIPGYGSTNAHPKSHDRDNASYVDSMFSYLSSQLLHHHGFLNAIDCYGSVLGHKRLLAIDAVDDIDYLLENEFFIENNNVLYETCNRFYNQVANHGSRDHKQAIQIHDDTGDDGTNLCDCIEELSGWDADTSTDNDQRVLTLNDVSDINDLENLTEIEDDGVPSKRLREVESLRPNAKTARTDSTSCSSRTSHTSNDHNSHDGHSNDHDECSTEHGSTDSDGTASEDSAIINIRDFPVNAIILEECEATLDYLCAEDEDFGSDELCAALMQVIMSLIAFHKCFDFQHNDLHTNNVMYVPTQKQFLYYKVNDRHYKVPTYGRIFKIIDFGRATFKFRGNQICSDSFHKDGDAHSQFNFGRCYNPSRPVIEPNNSFDLCRLGTSLIDFLVEDLDDINKTKDQTIMMVAEWCNDDRGRNVLWKANGDERYPGFKLYKMISRTVSKHTPITQLERPILDRFKCSRKNIRKGTTLMNIDALPSYTGTVQTVKEG